MIRSFVVALFAIVALATAAQAADIHWKTNPEWFGSYEQAFCGGRTCQSTKPAAKAKACTPRVKAALKKAYKSCDDVVVKFLDCKGTPRIGSTPYRMLRGVTYVPICVSGDKEVNHFLN